MALQPSGSPISFSQIRNEFGDSSPNENGSSLGNYRVSETYGEMVNIPLDEGIPQSGPIAFSDFYGKQLNMIVNFYDGGDEVKKNMKTRFNDASQVSVVGGFISPRPATTGGTNDASRKRVIVHVAKNIGSASQHEYTQPFNSSSNYNPYPANNKNEVSMVTGNWDAGTELDLWVGGSGFIVGAGGAGGKNGTDDGSNGPGDRGTSALGVTYPLNIYNYGKIAGGGGGGGGSPYAASRERSRGRRRFVFRRQYRRRDSRDANGGAGGGGAGYPAAPGGANRRNGNQTAGAGTLTTGGAGAAGGGRGAIAGGAGGAPGYAGVTIDNNGVGGDAGHAIIISGSGSATVNVGSNNIVGGTHNGQFDF